MRYLPNLDVLRFLLASLVIVFHVPQLSRNQNLPFFDDASIFHKGLEAVYMFFVLSGFLIIKIIYNEKLKGAFSINKFYKKRVLRILPLYIIILIFGLLFYNVILPWLNIPFEINYTLTEAVFFNLFFLPNVFSELFKPGGILEILWSIGIEEQFYLMIAPLLLVLNRNRILIALIVLTAIYFMSYHSFLYDYIGKFHMYYYFLFTGGIIAILEFQKKLEFLKSPILSILIVVLTGVSFFTDVLPMGALWLYHLIISILFPLFILAISTNNFGVVIGNKFINYLGRISYGIYMYHIIALNLVVFLFLKIENLQKLNDVSVILLIYTLTFAITIVLSHFSYKYIETYFLKLKSSL